MNEQKRLMLGAGVEHAARFCLANSLMLPTVEIVPSGEWYFDVCAFYRPTYIRVCIERTACIGSSGQQWSYPGYITDRTPYGVIAHEIGHHVDVTVSTVKRCYWGDFSESVRLEAREPRLTSYCPNDAEWFAEMMRLFITNPDLLRLIRPRTFRILRDRFAPITDAVASAAVNEHGLTPWDHVLHDAPYRTRIMAARKVEAASKGQLS